MGALPPASIDDDASPGIRVAVASSAARPPSPVADAESEHPEMVAASETSNATSDRVFVRMTAPKHLVCRQRSLGSPHEFVASDAGAGVAVPQSAPSGG